MIGMTQRPRRRLAVYTDASRLAGAEAALSTLVHHLHPALDVAVLGPHPNVVEAVAGVRAGTTTCITPQFATRRDLGYAAALRATIVDVDPAAMLLNKTEVGGLRYVELVARTVRGLHVGSVVHDVTDPGSRAALLLSRLLARCRGPVIAVGAHVGRQLETILDLRAGRVEVVPNAVAPITSFRRRADSAFTVGTLARFVPHKRVDLLLRALAVLPDARLVIGGDGVEGASLRALAADLGVDDRVSFLGWVDPAQVLDHCDVFALTSDREGWPIAILEAQQRGIPVVATAVGSVPEQITHGHNGILVDSGDLDGLVAALATVRDNPDEASAMGARARRAPVQRWTPTDMAGRYEALLGLDVPAMAGRS